MMSIKQQCHQREILGKSNWCRPGHYYYIPFWLLLWQRTVDEQMNHIDYHCSLLSTGVYVIGFSYPVVPKDKARIRVQISAAHTDEDIDHCVDAFIQTGRKHGVIAWTGQKKAGIQQPVWITERHRTACSSRSCCLLPMRPMSDVMELLVTFLVNGS